MHNQIYGYEQGGTKLNEWLNKAYSILVIRSVLHLQQVLLATYLTLRTIREGCER